jgi:hypothetical protein
MSNNIDNAVVKRVRKGIALLDKDGPADWRELIDLRILNIATIHNCVLGQLYGNYDVGMGKLASRACSYGKAAPDPGWYGFSLSKYGAETWDKLNQVWKQELKKAA